MNFFFFQFTSSESDTGSGRQLHTIENRIDKKDVGVRIGETVAAEGTEIMNQSNSSSFNDFDIYTRLRNEEGCVNVKIVSVIVRCNSYIQGFQVTWESTFRDGRVVRTQGTAHFNSSGYYADSGLTVDRTLTLAPAEFIHGIRVRQGEILDAIVFVTNMREVHFGGQGGSYINDDRMVPVELTREIVALTGTVPRNRVVQRVGFYSEKKAWKVVGIYIMMHWLIDMQRASVKRTRKRKRDDLRVPQEALIEVIRRLMKLSIDGPFSNVMMYLV